MPAVPGLLIPAVTIVAVGAAPVLRTPMPAVPVVAVGAAPVLQTPMPAVPVVAVAAAPVLRTPMPAILYSFAPPVAVWAALQLFLPYLHMKLQAPDPDHHNLFPFLPVRFPP